MTTRMQWRRGTSAEWATANPVLADGEAGFARDTGVFKVGNGTTAWNDLVAVLGEKVQVLPDNSVVESAAYTAYPPGISLMKLTTSSGWSINNGFGLLITYRLDSVRTRQHLYGHLTNDSWTRYFNTATWGSWSRVATRISATATLDFSSIPANSTMNMSVTVTGAVVGDAVALAPPDSLVAGLIAMGRVIAADTVSVRLANVTTAAIDPASATWGVSIIR